jgi:hypothetical protein
MARDQPAHLMVFSPPAAKTQFGSSVSPLTKKTKQQMTDPPGECHWSFPPKINDLLPNLDDADALHKVDPSGVSCGDPEELDLTRW